MLTVVNNNEGSNPAGQDRSILDEIVRDGARQMLAAALRAEVAAYIDQFVDQVDENGHRLVVRNGYHHEREVMTAAGAVAVAPGVNDKRVDRKPVSGRSFRRRSCLRGHARAGSLRCFRCCTCMGCPPVISGRLEQFLGSGAGLSAATITRLTSQWQKEAAAFADRAITADYVYLWVDGIHLKVRLEQEKLCLLVMIGVAPTARRNSSPWLMGIGNRPSRGPICCARANAAA
ncbi:hypothetical protein MMAGJ_00180 [Mycolicibacterium mageritense]|uniref:Mutator family transposase n=1 Tax=Mycolicibacterium mageritense TaxID=53462 RepID=A0ABM7HJS4_MYCME|nr:hypothetical protein MMAGJ_00180 [Mycolicibacterium mageritense]